MKWLRTPVSQRVFLTAKTSTVNWAASKIGTFMMVPTWKRRKKKCQQQQHKARVRLIQRHTLRVNCVHVIAIKTRQIHRYTSMRHEPTDIVYYYGHDCKCVCSEKQKILLRNSNKEEDDSMNWRKNEIKINEKTMTSIEKCVNKTFECLINYRINEVEICLCSA